MRERILNNIIGVLIGAVILIVISVFGVGIYGNGYRNGQLDALTGRILYEQVVTEEGSYVGWVERDKPGKVYREEE